MALRRFERLQDERWVAYTHSQMAKIYLETERLEMAEKHGLKGVEISERLSLKKEKADNYEVLAKVYRTKGDEEKANEYQTKYDLLIAGLATDVISKVAIPDQDSELINTAASPWSSILNTGIILLLVAISVVISGFVGSKK
jgi:hypothetical protein